MNLTGVVSCFEEVNSKGEKVSVGLQVALENGDSAIFYVNNVRKAKGRKGDRYAIVRNSEVAKLYRLTTGRNDPQAYSDGRRIFTALKDKKFYCEVEFKNGYKKIIRMKPFYPQYSSEWDENGAFLKGKNLNSMKVSLRNLEDSRAIDFDTDDDKFTLTVGELKQMNAQKRERAELEEKRNKIKYEAYLNYKPEPDLNNKELVDVNQNTSINLASTKNDIPMISDTGGDAVSIKPEAGKELSFIEKLVNKNASNQVEQNLKKEGCAQQKQKKIIPPGNEFIKSLLANHQDSNRRVSSVCH